MQKKVPAPGAVPVSMLLIAVGRILVKMLSPSALVMIVSRPVQNAADRYRVCRTLDTVPPRLNRLAPPMGPVSAEIEIDVPREEAFEAIADLARRPSFTDHFLTGFHLTRIESSGVGAGARFRLGPRRRSVWMDTTIDELDPPHRVVEHGRGGRANRIPATTVWELLEGPGGLTQVRVSHWTEPANPVDRAARGRSPAPPAGRSGAGARRCAGCATCSSRARPPPGRVAVAGGNRHETGIP